MKFARSIGSTALLTLALSIAGGAAADTVHVAVAANFASTLQRLSAAFKQQTGHAVVASSGASGQLYAQIKERAPFAVFLSADEERAKQLEADGLAEPNSRFIYAVGRLLLWSPDRRVLDGHGNPQLGDGRIAIAEPRTAPYGAAAVAWLRAHNHYKLLTRMRRLVVGTSIGQTLQFIESGAAPMGFVAMSQVIQADGRVRGHSWKVPGSEERLRQAAVLLKPHATDPAAIAFMKFLRSAAAGRIIERSGYGRIVPQ